MLRLPPTVISITMAEVRAADHRRRFKKHLEETTGIDKYHWQRPPYEQEQDLAASMMAMQVEDDKEADEVHDQVHEDNSRAGSPAPSVSAIDDEITDEQLLPLPSRSSRSEARHHVSTEAEEGLSRSDTRTWRSQARSNDGHSSWATTPGTSGAFNGASGSRTESHSHTGDGHEAASDRLPFRYRERKVDASLAGSPSSPSLPRTPSRLQIYDDSLPASSQPQTPQNLPEARHQSLLRAPWTAPPRVFSPRAPLFRTPTTNRARRRRGLPSPPGLQAPQGFMGLYGGTENIDDAVLYEQSSRALRSGDH
ncbi:hypothetical protein V8F20_007737 [Naviculisporaceae sp. PSN 640]